MEKHHEAFLDTFGGRRLDAGIGTRHVRLAHPGRLAGGKLPFDAAFVSDVREAKAQTSSRRGRDDALAYRALAPVGFGTGGETSQGTGSAADISEKLQGFHQPENDRSRGNPVEDASHLISVIAVQADAVPHAKSSPTPSPNKTKEGAG